MICQGHGAFDPQREAGCPTCVRIMREALRKIVFGKNAQGYAVDAQAVAREALQLDHCEECGGLKGGTRGNENRIDGKVLCDYCHYDLYLKNG